MNVNPVSRAHCEEHGLFDEPISVLLLPNYLSRGPHMGTWQQSMHTVRFFFSFRLPNLTRLGIEQSPRTVPALAQLLLPSKLDYAFRKRVLAPGRPDTSAHLDIRSSTPSAFALTLSAFASPHERTSPPFLCPPVAPNPLLSGSPRGQHSGAEMTS